MDLDLDPMSRFWMSLQQQSQLPFAMAMLLALYIHFSRVDNEVGIAVHI
jgi:hypothetical protein